MAFAGLGKVGVMLNNGDGTFAAMQQYSVAQPQCTALGVGLALDITLGDLSVPTDGKLDAYVACTPYVVRLTGNGTGALGNPEAFNVNLPPYLGSATIDFLALVRRPNGNPAPLLAFQHGVGSFGRELCISYDPSDNDPHCNHTAIQGPLAVGDLNGPIPGRAARRDRDRSGRRRAKQPDGRFRLLAPAAVGPVGQRSACRGRWRRVGRDRRPRRERPPRRARGPVREQRGRPRGVDPLLQDGAARAPAGRARRCRRSRGSTPWRSPTSTATAATTWLAPATTAAAWSTSATAPGTSPTARTCRSSAT